MRILEESETFGPDAKVIGNALEDQRTKFCPVVQDISDHTYIVVEHERYITYPIRFGKDGLLLIFTKGIAFNELDSIVMQI